MLQVVKVKLPSEKDKLPSEKVKLPSDNPIEEVIFFKKSKTPSDLPETLGKDTAQKQVRLCMAMKLIIPIIIILYLLEWPI